MSIERYRAGAIEIMELARLNVYEAGDGLPALDKATGRLLEIRFIAEGMIRADDLLSVETKGIILAKPGRYPASDLSGLARWESGEAGEGGKNEQD